MEYINLYTSESFGSDGGFGIRVEVAATKGLPDLENKEVRIATRKAVEMISGEIQALMVTNDPKTASRVEENAKLTELFPAPIYVEEIQNGYCGNWCCRHLPWFIVTTMVGRFTIGWRKRVISIDWSDTKNTGSSEDLFPDENVTKIGKSMHAWSMEDAKRYIETILESRNV